MQLGDSDRPGHPVGLCGFGRPWAGLETVESSRPKLEYVIDKGLAGTMWWALDLDDWNGRSCGMGKYPLIGGVKRLMKPWFYF